LPAPKKEEEKKVEPPQVQTPEPKKEEPHRPPPVVHHEEEKPKEIPVLELPNRFDAFKKCANGDESVTQEELADCIKLIPGGERAQRVA
jgi:hypothetical protein